VYIVKAKNAAESDPEGARKLGRASMGVSIAGVVITIIFIIIFVVNANTSAADADTENTTSYYY